jgi:hypothetical protein
MLGGIMLPLQVPFQKERNFYMTKIQKNPFRADSHSYLTPFSIFIILFPIQVLNRHQLIHSEYNPPSNYERR